jgi:hypothetical protein
MKRKRTPVIRMKMSEIQIAKFLGELHDIQLQFIDEAVEKSDLREAKEVIDYIKAKN